VEGEPSDDWVIRLKYLRDEYTKKKEKYLVDPHKVMAPDSNVENPLSLDENSAWDKVIFFFL
jgi:hypothetical protein